MERKPKGYVGLQHETIGSDVLSVLKVIKLPEMVLGKELTATLRQVQPDQWYPMSMLRDPVELLHKKVGDAALTQIGIELFRLSHAEAVKKVAKSARDIIFSLDDIYHRAHRGTDIGGWKVLSFEPGKAELEKTTPFHCILEQGILHEALATIGVSVIIEQTKCFRKGADCCEYRLTSFMRDDRWMGGNPTILKR